MLEGRWDTYEGAVFSEWNYHLHTCEPFPVPYGWTLWRGADDGYAAPCCVLWFAHDRVYDRIYVLQELYERGLTPERMAASVRALDQQLALSYGKEAPAPTPTGFGA